MLNKKKVLALGFGNMSAAVVTRMLNANVVDKGQIYAVVHGEKSGFNAEKLGVEQFDANKNIDFDVLLLGLKPQLYSDVLPLYEKYLKKGAIVISMMAGVPVENVTNIFEDKSNFSVVRIMPNTPCVIGKGIVAIYCEDHQQQKPLKNIFSACGEVVFLDKEDDMHLVTALSGSGPAYFYYFIECMVEQTQKMGLDEGVAIKLVAATCEGAGASVLKNMGQQNIIQMRNQVTSKGGTTEAGVSALLENNVKDILSQVVQKAVDRSKELSL